MQIYRATNGNNIQMIEGDNKNASIFITPKLLKLRGDRKRECKEVYFALIHCALGEKALAALQQFKIQISNGKPVNGSNIPINQFVGLSAWRYRTVPRYQDYASRTHAYTSLFMSRF